MVRVFEALPKEEQEFYRKVFSGEAVAPLCSDTIAKNVVNADVHPERFHFRNCSRPVRTGSFLCQWKNEKRFCKVSWQISMRMSGWYNLRQRHERQLRRQEEGRMGA